MVVGLGIRVRVRVRGNGSRVTSIALLAPSVWGVMLRLGVSGDSQPGKGKDKEKGKVKVR